MKLALVTLVALLATAGIASAANGKTRVQVDRFADTYLFAVDCGGFDDVASGNEHVDVTEVYAADDGTLLQTVFQVGFTETDTNSVTGKTLASTAWLTRCGTTHRTPAHSAAPSSPAPIPATAPGCRTRGRSA